MAARLLFSAITVVLGAIHVLAHADDKHEKHEHSHEKHEHSHDKHEHPPHGPPPFNWEKFQTMLPPMLQQASKFPWNTNTKALKEDIPDTSVKGAGYIADCDPAKCKGGDANYYLEAKLRNFKIKNSKLIETTKPGTYPNFHSSHKISDEDVTFLTRHVQAMEGAPNSPFGPDAFGGDGMQGILGPALQMLPGTTVYLMVKNSIDPDYQMKGYAPTRENYAQKVNNWVQTGSRMVISSIGSNNEITVLPNGTGQPNMQAAGMDMPNPVNVPGWDTNHSFNQFNIHLHGMEVAPHLFHPMGTSDPEAPWITIEPTPENGRQCYCYKFDISPKASKGLFAWHTHRHGTESMTTWSGMFGALVTDNYILPSDAPTQKLPASDYPATNPASSMMYNLVQMAQEKQISFTDDDVYPFVVYNSMWKFTGDKYMQENPTDNQKFPASTHSKDAQHVEVNNFLSNEIPTTQVVPFLTNNEYQPTFHATAGHLSLFRILCISAQYLCGFQITDEKGDVVPFHVISSDGITFKHPEYYPARPDLVHGVLDTAAKVATLGNPVGSTAVKAIEDLQPQDLAYLQLGGGMRQDVLVQFEVAGNYTIAQHGYPGFNPYQKLATVIVKSSPFCGHSVAFKCFPKTIDEYTFTAARDVERIERRPTTRHLGLNFRQELNRSKIPFVQWGTSAQYGLGFQPYNETDVNMVAEGGQCAVWTIRSNDVIFHPFHIHVNPFVVIDVEMAPSSSLIAPSAALAQKLLTASAFYAHTLEGHWRDTVMIPPMGQVVLKQCWDAGPAIDSVGTQLARFAGKFVFHCHFLTHSDTGLMHNFMLTKGLPMSPRQAPGSIFPANTKQCPSNDPCGLGHAHGCSRCPEEAEVHGCSCIVPIDGEVVSQAAAATDGVRKALDRSATAALGRPLSQRVLALESALLISLALVAGVALALRRGGRRAAAAAAPQTSSKPSAADGEGRRYEESSEEREPCVVEWA